MYDRVTVGVSDLEASKAFYEAGFTALFAMERETRDSFARWDRFAIDAARPVARNAHVAFQASTQDLVHTFYDAVLAAGGTDNGEPGPRPQYGPRVYAAYVLDPDGINVEATFRPMSEWPIDHVVLGVEDLAESKRFYDVALRAVGRGLIGEFTDAVCYGTQDGALWIADRDVTEGIELTVAAVNPAAIEAFWNAAVEAGFESASEPGDAPDYAADRYAASVLDPDGNVLRAVCIKP
jgi:catechol 2,3-dioxygenase-like lactoylglutathione lyase family enzyme